MFFSPCRAISLLKHCLLSTILWNVIAPHIPRDRTSNQALSVIQPTEATKCDFEHYATGCYAAANFVCDPHSNECKCHQDVPVLIDNRWCMKRSKYNQICQYNQQCDNSNGLYCLYNDFRATSSRRLAHTLTHFSERYPRCRCKSSDYVRAFVGENDNEICVHKSKHSADTRLPPGTIVPPDNLRLHSVASNGQYSTSESETSPNEHQSKPTRHSSNIVWYIFIFIICTVLCLYGALSCRNNKHYERNLNNMEPPPYEIAIKY